MANQVTLALDSSTVPLVEKLKEFKCGFDAVDGLSERRNAILENPSILLERNLGCLRLGADIHADVTQLLTTYSSQITAITKKARWGRIPWFNRFQAFEIVGSSETSLQSINAQLIELEEFLQTAINKLRPDFVLLQQDAVIAAQDFPDYQLRIATLHSAVQTMQIVMMCLDQCLSRCYSDRHRIEYLLHVTIPAWILAKTQKKMLNVVKLSANISLSESVAALTQSRKLK